MEVSEPTRAPADGCSGAWWIIPGGVQSVHLIAVHLIAVKLFPSVSSSKFCQHELFVDTVILDLFVPCCSYTWPRKLCTSCHHLCPFCTGAETTKHEANSAARVGGSPNGPDLWAWYCVKGKTSCSEWKQAWNRRGSIAPNRKRLVESRVWASLLYLHTTQPHFLWVSHCEKMLIFFIYC